MTIQILDQSMSSMQIQENDLQLAAGAAFWMAAKVDGCDVNAGKISVGINIFFTNGVL
jgi:Cyclin, N-terminal domain